MENKQGVVIQKVRIVSCIDVILANVKVNSNDITVNKHQATKPTKQSKQIVNTLKSFLHHTESPKNYNN